jgi:hypothetical protein
MVAWIGPHCQMLNVLSHLEILAETVWDTQREYALRAKLSNAIIGTARPIASLWRRGFR